MKFTTLFALLVGLLAGFVASHQSASASGSVNSSGSEAVEPLPAAPTYTVNCTMPSGAPGCCVQLDGGGYGVSVSCRATGDCDYRIGRHNVDGGWPVFADGGGYVLIGADEYLPASSIRVMKLPKWADAVCMGTAGGGTNSVGVNGP